jgi:DNA primase
LKYQHLSEKLLKSSYANFALVNLMRMRTDKRPPESDRKFSAMLALHDLYKRLDLETVLRDLQPVDKGNYYILTCPACGRREAFIYKGKSRIRCNRLNKCGTHTNLWGYVQMSYNLSHAETFKKLADLAGLEFAEKDFSFDFVRAKKAPRRYRVWHGESDREPVARPEIAGYHKKYQKALVEHSPAEKYLKWRKISFETARFYGLGYSAPNAWCHFKNGKPVRQWRHGHLIFPLENIRGELVNFQARALDSKGIARTLRLSHDLLPGPKGAFSARILRQSKTVFLCEGVLDALTLAQTGIKNVVATIGLGGIYWHWLKNVENLVICFDIDPAGEREFCKIARDAGLSGMNVYRLPAEIYGGQKDLNDALCADVLNGVALFDFCERFKLLEERKVAKPRTNDLIERLIETLEGEEVSEDIFNEKPDSPPLLIIEPAR